MDRLFVLPRDYWMLLFGAVICFLLLAISSSHAGAASRPDPDLIAALDTPSTELVYPEAVLPFEHARSAPSTESTLTSNFRPENHEKHFSFVIPSVVYHGFAIDKDVANQMPRKIDGGQTVITPGVGIEYVSSGGFLVLGGVLKDCYDDLAGMIQVGQQFKLWSHTTIGYSLGIYARETPMSCSTTTDRRGRKSTTCDEFDNYQLKWMTTINGESVDIIPMPFIHFTTALVRFDAFEVDFKVMTNFALNEFGFSVPF